MAKSHPAQAKLDSQHAASPHVVRWTSLGPCLVLASAIGCGTSNAVISGPPASGVGAAPGAGLGAGCPGLPAITGAAAAGSGSVVVAPSVSSAGAVAIPPPLATAPPAAVGCRSSRYGLAVRLTVETGWQETVAITGGTGKTYVWSKLTIDPGPGKISEFRACGTLLPVLHTTAVAGNTQAFARAPQPSFDRPSMPTASGGSATRVSTTLMLDPGPLLVGVVLPEPAGPWPASSTDRSVMPVDADGDGKPGLTALVRNDGNFAGSPTSILVTERIDASYGASRLAYRARLDDSACAASLEGPAEILALDTLLVGCHVKDRDDCSPEEHKFVEDNRPQLIFGAAVATAAVIPSDATCAQAVAVLDVPGP